MTAKLGDTKDFMLIGSNDFSGPSFTGSTITWVTKPPSGTTCPAPSAFQAGVTGTLKDGAQIKIEKPKKKDDEKK